MFIQKTDPIARVSFLCVYLRPGPRPPRPAPEGPPIFGLLPMVGRAVPGLPGVTVFLCKGAGLAAGLAGAIAGRAALGAAARGLGGAGLR